MNENQHITRADFKTSTRTKTADPIHRQKELGAKRKGAALSTQALNSRSQPPQTKAHSEKERKKLAKHDIPVSLDIDPFSGSLYTNPKSEMERKLLEKGQSANGDEGGGGSGSPANEQELDELKAELKKAKTETTTLKHQLVETKAELRAADHALREKDTIIKDQMERIDDLIETRVPRDDMDEIIDENKRLTAELKENEALLAECQQLLEEYVTAENQD